MLKEITKEGKALLIAITGSESDGSYNLLNGGKRFNDYTNHPFASTNKATGYGVAAGRYQFMPATWNAYKTKLGVPDFSPESQDKAAWALAQVDYKRNSGGKELQAELEKGNLDSVARGLNTTWTSLPHGKETNSQTAKFLSRYEQAVAGGGLFGKGSEFGNAAANAVRRLMGEPEVAYEDTESGKAAIASYNEPSVMGGIAQRLIVGVSGIILLTIGLIKLKA